MDYRELVAASQPEALRAALADHADQLRHAAQHDHGLEETASVRTFEHGDHTIVIKTTYEITVDGNAFEVPLTVDNNGRVSYHGLPTRDFASTVDLVKKVIDYFPADFRPSDGQHHDRQHDRDQDGKHDDHHVDHDHDHDDHVDHDHDHDEHADHDHDHGGGH